MLNFLIVLKFKPKIKSLGPLGHSVRVYTLGLGRPEPGGEGYVSGLKEK